MQSWRRRPSLRSVVRRCWSAISRNMSEIIETVFYPFREAEHLDSNVEQNQRFFCQNNLNRLQDKLIQKSREMQHAGLMLIDKPNLAQPNLAQLSLT